MTALSFQDASKEFLDTLSDDEKVYFAKIKTPDDIITELKDLKAPGFTEGRSRRALTRITTFIERATPYFKIVDIAIQSDPTVAAIVWSSIRFVMQLGLNFSSFMDKLTLKIERIGLMLPMYEQYVDIFKHKIPKPLEESLRRVYSDLLLFFHECIRLFSKDRSRVPKTPRLIANLLWVPFDTRFSEILDRIQEHHDIVKEEAQIASLTLEAAERAEHKKERERQERSRIKLQQVLKLSESAKAERIQKSKAKVIERCLKWIAPGNFTRPFERAVGTREDGTAEWIFDTPEYLQWEQDRIQGTPSLKKLNHNLFWISGPPGRGKTILAGSIAERHKNLNGASSAYFFFEKKGNGQTESEDAYRAIVAQLLAHNSQDERIVDKVSFFLDNRRYKPTGQLVASRGQLLDILGILIPSLSTTAFVIDAVDECQDRRALLSDLFNLAELPNIKLILLSRPNVPEICKRSDNILTLSLESSVVRGDIEIYLQRHLLDMQSSCMLSSDLDFQDAYNRLLDGANGMFLWVSLMVNLLQSEVLTPWQRRQIIVSVILPEGLDRMYDRILEFIASQGNTERKIAQHILSWIINQDIIMSKTELRIALSLVVQGAQGLNNYISDDAIIISCAGLVERVVQKDEVIFQPIHLSLTEYLRDMEHMTGKTQWMPTCKIKIHEELTAACLIYLTYAVPTGPLAGEFWVQPDRWHVGATFPFIRYAVRNWTLHMKKFTEGYTMHNHTNPQLCKAVNMDNISSAFQNFISHKAVVMTWIEAHYLFNCKADKFGNRTSNRTPDFRDIGLIGENLNGILADAPSNCTNILSSKLHQLSADLQQLHEDWGTVLVEDPQKIWLDITAFSKSDFWLESSVTKVETFNVKEERRTQRIEDGSSTNDEHTPFAAADCVYEDGSAVGILTIHSSQMMNNLLKRETPITFENLHQCSSGWRAKYEIWELRKPTKRLCQIWLELSQEEIWIQLCQTLRQDESSRQWRIQFPLAIRADLKLFAILRTVYRFETPRGIPCRNQSPDARSTRITSLKLPVEDLPQAFKNWHSSASLDRMGLVNINAVEHFFEYDLTFGPNASYIAYTHHERGSKKRSIAVFNLLWDGNQPRADVLGSRSFVGGPSLEEIAAGVYHFDKVEAQLKEGAKNCSNFAVGRIIAAGRSLLAFHPQKQLLAYSTFFGISLWDYITDQSEDLYAKSSEHQSTNLKFSECGSYITIIDHKKAASFNPMQIISLEGRRVLDGSSFYNVDPVCSEKEQQVVTRTLKRKIQETDLVDDSTQDQAVSLRANHSKRIADSGSLQLSSRNGNHTVEWLSYDHQRNTVDIRRIARNGVHTRRSLCSLPQGEKYKDKTAIVSDGMEGEDHINIILQSVPKHWHAIGVDSSCSDEMPVIIQRTRGTFEPEISWDRERPNVETPIWKLLNERSGLIEEPESAHLAFHNIATKQPKMFLDQGPVLDTHERNRIPQFPKLDAPIIPSYDEDDYRNPPRFRLYMSY